MKSPLVPTSSPGPRRSSARVLLVTALLGLGLPLSACGGHGSAQTRPSVEEITQSLTSGSLADEMGLDKAALPESTFACVAQKLEDSDLSDAALRALVEADKDFEPSDADQKAVGHLSSQMGSCAAQ